MIQFQLTYVKTGRKKIYRHIIFLYVQYLIGSHLFASYVLVLPPWQNFPVFVIEAALLDHNHRSKFLLYLNEVTNVLNLAILFFACMVYSPRQSHFLILHDSHQQHTTTTVQTTGESRWAWRPSLHLFSFLLSGVLNQTSISNQIQ